MRNRRPVVDRFWAKVVQGKSDRCWLWTGGLDSGGYGCFWDGKRTMGAHCYSLSLKLNRSLVKGEWALHTCDTPACVNPAHLFLGDSQANQIDAMRKRRRGTLITEKDVREIRRRYISGETSTALATSYGISPSNILAIVTRRSWAWVPDGLIDTRNRAAKHRRGSSAPCVKLTEAKVLQMRQLHREGWSIRQLAQKFGVAYSTVPNILAHRTWRHV